MLEVDIRSKAYRTAFGEPLPALGRVAFTVAPGEFVCLTGPSGCGKTTTLRIVLGLDRDFEGTVRRPSGRMAAVFQEPRLLPWRTVEQNLRLALPDELTGTDLAPLLASLGLAETGNLYPGELSLGMARRVALARALATQPSLVLMDEPFASLDEATADRMRALLPTYLEARSTGVLMVTHNLREAAQLGDRIVTLSPRPGEVVSDIAIDTPRERRDARVIDDIVARIQATASKLPAKGIDITS